MKYRSINSYSSVGLQGISLGIYPQVKLVLHLEKTQNITWKNVLIEYEYDDGRIFQAIIQIFQISLYRSM